MFGQPTPFPWWLWWLAGLWTAGLVLRCVWRSGRDAGRWLDVLIAFYTGLLAYMAASATTAGLPPVGWIRAGWWVGGIMALTGGLLCASGDTPSWRTLGWLLATTGLAWIAVWIAAPELAVLCGVVGLAGLRTPPDSAAEETGPSAESHQDSAPDAWLVAIAATLACVTWLGTVEFAFRTETMRTGMSPRLTALPPVTREARNEPVGSSILLAGMVAALAWLAARPQKSAEEEDTCPPS